MSNYSISTTTGEAHPRVDELQSKYAAFNSILQWDIFTLLTTNRFQQKKINFDSYDRELNELVGNNLFIFTKARSHEPDETDGEQSAIGPTLGNSDETDRVVTDRVVTGRVVTGRVATGRNRRWPGHQTPETRLPNPFRAIVSLEYDAVSASSRLAIDSIDRDNRLVRAAWCRSRRGHSYETDLDLVHNFNLKFCVLQMKLWKIIYKERKKEIQK